VKVLVTGGAGFIGSSVALALAREGGHEVVALDNLYRRGSELNLPRLADAGVRFVHGDVRQPEDLRAAGDFEALVECSAEPSVLAAGDVVVPVNLFGAHHCIEAAGRHGAQVVFLSTSRVYPVAALEALAVREAETRYELVDEQLLAGASAQGVAEEFPLRGARTAYGASKLAAEILLAEAPVPWVVNRCGVVAGPWQMGKVDQGVFTHWLLAFHFGLPLAYIGYGATGKQVRDVLHVDDLVRLVADQLDRPAHWAGQTFNVGGGRDGSLSLLEASELCAELTGRDMRVGREPRTRPGDVRCYVSDCRRLFEHCEWRPDRAPREILEDIAAWVADHEGLVRSTLLAPGDRR